MPKSPKSASSQIPGTFKRFIAKYPAMGKAHEQVAQAAQAAGPLTKKQTELIKIGISLGAGLESALKSHIRRAIEAGATQQEIEQAILLAMNTVGFPRMVAAWSWAQDQFDRD